MSLRDMQINEMSDVEKKKFEFPPEGRQVCIINKIELNDDIGKAVLFCSTADGKRYRDYIKLQTADEEGNITPNKKGEGKMKTLIRSILGPDYAEIVGEDLGSFVDYVNDIAQALDRGFAVDVEIKHWVIDGEIKGLNIWEFRRLRPEDVEEYGIPENQYCEDE